MTSGFARHSIPATTINQIQQRDAIEGLKSLPDNSIDLVVTDPPYNIASRTRATLQDGKIVSTMVAWGAWDTFVPFDYDILIRQLISEAYRVLKPNGSFYMFTAREQNGHYVRLAVERGFTYRNQLVMIKKNPLPSFAKSNWRSGFEICMYLTKGKPAAFNFLSQQECVNTFAYANSRKQTKHPTEKPLAFIKRLVDVSSRPGDVVLDPFMGSGTTAVAARELGRKFVGFDTSEEYVAMARNRLSSVKQERSQGRRDALGRHYDPVHQTDTRRISKFLQGRHVIENALAPQ